MHTTGDPNAVFAKGGKVIEAEYFAPHLAHASMEPPAYGLRRIISLSSKPLFCGTGAKLSMWLSAPMGIAS